MLRAHCFPDGSHREIDALFTLDSLAINTAPLTEYLGLKNLDSRYMPPRNTSQPRAKRADLSGIRLTQLQEYLAPDLRLYDAVRKAGGAWISGTETSLSQIG